MVEYVTTGGAAPAKVFGEIVDDIAQTGTFVHDWCLVRLALAHEAAIAFRHVTELEVVVQHGEAVIPTVSVAGGDATATQDVLARLQALPEAPFTLQRLCELCRATENPADDDGEDDSRQQRRRQYGTADKLHHAFTRLLDVTSTLPPVALDDRWTLHHAKEQSEALAAASTVEASVSKRSRPVDEATDGAGTSEPTEADGSATSNTEDEAPSKRGR